MTKLISVEVVYARPDETCSIKLEMQEKSTLADAIYASGILKRFPEIDLAQQTVGVFSKPKRLTDSLKAGDRIEIYRSLVLDPKEVRRKKARIKS